MKTKQKKLIAGLLAICPLTGGLGGHYFYLKKPGLGFLYLSICWTGLPAFFSVLEGFKFVSQNDQDFKKTVKKL